jgi:hypothetical protein
LKLLLIERCCFRKYKFAITAIVPPFFPAVAVMLLVVELTRPSRRKSPCITQSTIYRMNGVNKCTTRTNGIVSYNTARFFVRKIINSNKKSLRITYAIILTARTEMLPPSAAVAVMLLVVELPVHQSGRIHI